MARVRDLCRRLSARRRIDRRGGPRTGWVIYLDCAFGTLCSERALRLLAACGVEALWRTLAAAFHRRMALTVFMHMGKRPMFLVVPALRDAMDRRTFAWAFATNVIASSAFW